MSDSTSPDEQDSLLIWGVPPDLKAKFKSRCADEQRTMKEVIIQFMAAFAATDPIGK